MTELSLDFVFAAALYVVVLVVIGVGARQHRVLNTLGDYFLANRSLGLGVLVLTLFATQYSANSLIGFPGQVYREGLSYFMSVALTVSIVTGYLLFAPRLFSLSRAHGFVTPTDYLAHRFQSPVINYMSAGIFLVSLTNFLLAQFVALGQAFNHLTNGVIPYWVAVVVGAGVVVTYQLLGGMRAVAAADVFQGCVLLGGLILLAVFVWIEVGSPAEVMRTLQVLRPDVVASPDWERNLVWLSNLGLFGLAAPLYPQAIQRIYAARRLKDLRKALAIMAVVPLVAISIVIFVSMAGIALFPQGDRFAGDEMTFRLVSYLYESTALAYYPAIIVALAVMAAIISTADSCLLSLTSIVTKDIVARRQRLEGGDLEQLSKLVPWVSVAILVAVVLIAMRPLTSLWGLLVIKFEILIQLSPAFVLGTLHDRGDRDAYEVPSIVSGLLVGLATTLALYLTGFGSVYGLHAGFIGVAANYAVVVGVQTARRQTGPLTITASRRSRRARN